MLVADAANVADWMQAWGTVIGAFTSTLAIVLTGLLLRHEIRARGADERAANEAQARLVVVTRISTDRMIVRNHSSAPIYHVAPYVMFREQWKELQRSGGIAYVSHIDPGEQAELSWFRQPLTFQNDAPGGPIAMARFTDNNGRRWAAMTGGSLKPSDGSGDRQGPWVDFGSASGTS